MGGGGGARGARGWGGPGAPDGAARDRDADGMGEWTAGRGGGGGGAPRPEGQGRRRPRRRRRRRLPSAGLLRLHRPEATAAVRETVAVTPTAAGGRAPTLPPTPGWCWLAACTQRGLSSGWTSAYVSSPAGPSEGGSWKGGIRSQEQGKPPPPTGAQRVPQPCTAACRGELSSLLGKRQRRVDEQEPSGDPLFSGDGCQGG